jgi:hypothetical protein
LKGSQACLSDACHRPPQHAVHACPERVVACLALSAGGAGGLWHAPQPALTCAR